MTTQILSSERQKGVLALALLALFFASMGLFARYLATGFTAMQQVYLRIAAAFLWGLIIFNKKLHISKLKKFHLMNGAFFFLEL